MSGLVGNSRRHVLSCRGSNVCESYSTLARVLNPVGSILKSIMAGSPDLAVLFDPVPKIITSTLNSHHLHVNNIPPFNFLPMMGFP